MNTEQSHHQTHQQTMDINHFPPLPPHTAQTPPTMYHTPLSSTAEIISLATSALLDDRQMSPNNAIIPKIIK